MTVALLIPARFESTRFPGKPLAALKGCDGTAKPLIQRSVEAARRVHGADSIHVATDDERVARAARDCGAQVLMTSRACRNGTERCAQALDALGGSVDLVVNLQGDALLTPPEMVDSLIARMAADDIAVATPAFRLRSEDIAALRNEEAAGRVGGTFVVAADSGRALYFSKRMIPYLPADAAGGGQGAIRLHVGLYAYRPAALRSYAAMAPGRLEMLEGLEQLRFLENGIDIAVVDVAAPQYALRELNNPEDVEPIEEALRSAGIA